MIRTAVLFLILSALVASLLTLPRSSANLFTNQTQDSNESLEATRIFASKCASCHGPDKQKGGLRLDRKAEALAGGDNGAVIVSKKPADSLLVKRITSRDADIRMPPIGERLSENEIRTIRDWIEKGANWPDDGLAKEKASDWWSFQPVTRLAVPAKTNPVDHFIRLKLKEKKLSPSASADRRTLIRRIYFDVIGLPPKPEEIAAFVADPDPLAYEKLVDKLLASPHYGERWARHWLDVVHFGETHGYDKDQPRPNAWPYRDYVIRSLNEDKPYERFLREQIAVDVLYPNTRDGIEALGFLSAGPWDFIGHVEVPESKIDGKIARHLDRDDVVANTISTFLGLTVHCAQCHNHKFDPILQEDYYRLQAVFAAIDRTDKAYDVDPKIAERRASLEKAKRAAESIIRSAKDVAKSKAGNELAEIDQRLEKSRANLKKLPPEYGYHSALAASSIVEKWVQIDLESKKVIERIVLWPCHDDFNDIGAGFGFPVRYKVELCDTPEFQIGVKMVWNQTTKDVPNPGTSPIRISAAGKEGRYLRVTVTKLASRLSNDFMFALAEVEIFDAKENNLAFHALVTALDSIEAPVRWRKSNLTDGFYPSSRKLSSAEIEQLHRRREEIIAKTLDSKTVSEFEKAKNELQRIEKEWKSLPTQTQAYIGTVHNGSGTFIGTGPNGGKPRPIYILPRGDVTKPGKEVSAGGIRSIPGINSEFELPKDHSEGMRRAALANWVADKNNPLIWRVMANRVWQYHFGRGLVDSPNDFGKMGQLPTHPELLDWLAAELREHQSLKTLHKIILTSETYRQSSNSNPAFETIDAENRLFWRQQRRKLDAEAVRDSILSVAGKLNLIMGGPSFQDFVIEKPEHSPHYQYHLHDPEDPKSHRRAIYRFVVRSKQQPFLASLDCADPSLSVEKRNETQTPQQALALLNNALVLTMAKHFAERVEKIGKDDRSRISAAFELALGRPPNERELTALMEYVQTHGLANGCRAILNLNEFLFVD